jgi:hypothetical protein
MMNIWPLTAQPPLSVGGVCLTEIAERFGTPAYVLDEEHVRVRCREYSKAIAPNEVAYAGKAFWCRAMIDHKDRGTPDTATSCAIRPTVCRGSTADPSPRPTASTPGAQAHPSRLRAVEAQAVRQ